MMSKNKRFIVTRQFAAFMLLLLISPVEAGYAFYMESIQIEAAQIESAKVNNKNTVNDDVEKIEVLGKMPANLLRKAFYRQEDNFFDLYNELIDENQFRMDCEMRSMHLQSKVKHRACIPRFVEIENARELETAALRSGRLDASSILNAVPDKAALRLIYAKKKKEMAKKMADLINSNPELAKRYTQYVEAKTKFENVKNR
ncbi:hypothetical protein [Alteromonas sp. P256]|uniref:hypothetical protein n=1 Tax=Alteromonas sp. P256 TaxID=3117399 RepID=UPI002FE1A908